MRVVMLAPEIHPYAKTGGLADVLAALPRALAPAFLRAAPELYPELAGVRSVLTIHNLAYQGRFPERDWHLLNLDRRWFVPDFLEFYHDVNFLKAGIVFADAITTVSPRYASEIETPELGEGLDGILRTRRGRHRTCV